MAANTEPGFASNINNFRAPDLNRKNFLVGPDTKVTYKNCRKIKRKFYDTSVVLNLALIKAGMRF